jgi:NAD(P)-dependent dehydrogenase (short-subunit alcohol dehydrogenase family)
MMVDSHVIVPTAANALFEDWPNGRVVLITGAAGGIGQSCVRIFNSAGAQLVLSGRNISALEEIAGACFDETGRSPVLVPADLTNFRDVQTVFAGISPDVVVHAVGANQAEPLVDVTEETYDRLMAQNVRSAFFVCQAAARSMSRGGAIVMITSQMGHVGAANRTVYCTAKHAVEGFVKAAGTELAPHGIRVISVAPTFVETPMTASMLRNATRRDAIIGKIPMARLATSEDVAGAVLFAASPAAGMITGSSILVDGGWTAN